MAIVYGLKVNLSVTMVAMLNHTSIRHASDVPPVQIDQAVSNILGNISSSTNANYDFNEHCSALSTQAANTVMLCF